MKLRKHSQYLSRKSQCRKSKKLLILLLVTAISSQSMLTSFAATDTDTADIDPKKASYGYYVEAYKNNTKDNMTPESNPSIGVLSGFLNLWTPGTAWNNGTNLNATILNMNILKSVLITNNRTSTQEIEAYLDDRRHHTR